MNGRIGPVKSEYSEDELPLDPDFANVLLDLKRKSTASELLFPSPVTGRAYHASPIQQDYLRRAGWCLVECPQCGAAPGVVCNDVTEGRGKVRTIPVHDARRQLATEKVSEASGGIRSATPTGLFSAKGVRHWTCSRN